MSRDERSEVQILKGLYPDLVFDENGFYLEGAEELLYDLEQARAAIEDHYDGWKAEFSHPSNNPELEYAEAVDGRLYIEQNFHSDYVEAFNQI